jgi:hypothetical protein
MDDRARTALALRFWPRARSGRRRRIDSAPNSSKMERMEILPRIMEARVRRVLEREK